MRFLLFNLAVVAALFYLFNADGGGSGRGADFREDPLQSIRQELETLARDIAQGRDHAGQAAPQSAENKSPEPDKEAPPAPAVDPQQNGSTSAATPAAVPTAAPAVAQTVDTGRPEGAALAGSIGQLPQVDDPAVARRRAEVLDGALAPADEVAETPSEAGPPMSPEERLRKLYSLAEEMELLYVRKVAR